MHINSGTIVAVNEAGWLHNRLADVMSLIPGRVYLHQQKAEIVLRMDSGHVARIYPDKHAAYFKHLEGSHVRLYSKRAGEPGLQSDPWASNSLPAGKSADGDFDVVLGSGDRGKDIEVRGLFRDRGLSGDDFFTALKNMPETLPIGEPPSLQEIFAHYTERSEWTSAGWSEEYEPTEEECRRERAHNALEKKRVAQASETIRQLFEGLEGNPSLERALRQTANDMLCVNGARLLHDRGVVFVPKVSNDGIRAADGIKVDAWGGLEPVRDAFAKAVAGETYIAVMAVDGSGVPVHAIVPQDQKEKLPPEKLCAFGWQKRSF